MIISATKKTILLLSVISFNSSAFGMFDNAQKKIPTLVLSQRKQIATAVFVPLAVAGCVVLAQHKEDISSLLEKIPVPSEKVLFGLATAAAMPGTYFLLNRFSSEEQFKLYQNNSAEIKKHKIFQHKKMLEQFVAGQEKASLNKEKASITLLQFINYNFGDEAGDGIDSSIKIVKELCQLENRINAERQRLAKMVDAKIEKVIINTTSINSYNPSNELEVLDAELKFIEEFRGTIFDLPEYKQDKQDRAAMKQACLTAEQITFSSKIGAFVPLFIQPVATFSMILLQVFLNKIGLTYRVI